MSDRREVVAKEVYEIERESWNRTAGGEEQLPPWEEVSTDEEMSGFAWAGADRILAALEGEGEEGLNLAEIVRKTPDTEAANCLQDLSHTLHDVERIRVNLEWAMKVIGRLLIHRTPDSGEGGDCTCVRHGLRATNIKNDPDCPIHGADSPGPEGSDDAPGFSLDGSDEHLVETCMQVWARANLSNNRRQWEAAKAYRDEILRRLRRTSTGGGGRELPECVERSDWEDQNVLLTTFTVTVLREDAAATERILRALDEEGERDG